MKIWRCEICGYLHEGEEPPDFCPKCGAPKSKFVLLDDEEARMMVEAKETKEKYRQILERLDQINQLAKEGIGLDLDEGCNKIFNHTVTSIESVRRMIKEELAGHANECIWVKVASDGELP